MKKGSQNEMELSVDKPSPFKLALSFVTERARAQNPSLEEKPENGCT